MSEICPIWNEECSGECMEGRNDIPSNLSYSSFEKMKCLRAGVFAYRYFNRVQRMTARLDEDAKIRLCAEIAYQNEVHDNPQTLDETLIRKIEFQSIPLMPARLDLALKWLVRHSPVIGAQPLRDLKQVPSFLAFCYCYVRDEISPIGIGILQGEMEMILDALLDEGLVKFPNVGNSGYTDHSIIKVTHKGYARYQELERESVDSSLAFVAMWFNDSMNPLREAIKAGIEAAGYIPQFVDTHGSAANRIEDEIIALIRQSRFVVADFTASTTPIKSEDEANARGGVYYEAGFAHGLGRPVFFTCRKDYIDTPKALHFDTSHFLHLDWEENGLGEDGRFREELRKRIIAVVGKGPEPPKKKKGEDAAAGN